MIIALLTIGGTVRGEPAALPSNEDLRHVRSLSDPRISPDGAAVLLNIADATADGGRSHVWLVDVARNTSRQMTFSPAADKRGEHHARWLGAGDSIVFLAKRVERVQLFRLPMSGGEARAYDLKSTPVVDASADADALPPKAKDVPPASPEPLPLEVSDFECSPDGRTIAVVALDPETAGEKKQKEEKADAVWVSHDLHGKRLYLLDAESGKLTVVLAPPDIGALSWSPRGDRLLMLAEAPNKLSDLGPATTGWLVDPKDPVHPTQVKELPGSVEAIGWSREGSKLYFRAQSSEDAPPGYLDFFTLDLADRSIHNLTKDFSGSVEDGRIMPVEEGVLQSVRIGVKRSFIRLSGGKTSVLAFNSPVVSSLDTDMKHSAWVWLGQSSGQPNALYYGKQLDGEARRLNTPSLLPHAWPDASAQIIHWKNEGLPLEGLLWMPAATGSKVPLIVDVHGGPTGAWDDRFDPLLGFFLGQGWAVFRPNPRGSTGYGARFAAANKNDLGGGDYRDIMTGTDAVVAQFPVDADKLILMGYSYGGEMAGFVEGKTDRFKAIISGAPVIDQHSEYGTEDDSWYDRWFYGKPWENAEAAWRQSPLAHVAHAKTPFLLIQGEADSTDPLGQSQEMYRALRQVGVPVQMVQYPREDHGPLAGGMYGFPSPEPWHGFDVRQRIVKFINAALAP